MKSENKNIFNLFSFIVLVIAAVLIFVNKLLPVIGINAGGPLFAILDTIKDVLILIVIGLLAYNFAKGKKKGWKITYWVSLGLFVAGIVLGVVKII